MRKSCRSFFTLLLQITIPYPEAPHQDVSLRLSSQVDADLFDRFKEFFKEKGIKQNAFFLDCIEKAMTAWEQPETDEDAEPETEE